MSTDQRDGGRAGDVQGPTVPRMLVGIQLHRFREAAGITPDQAAYEIRAECGTVVSIPVPAVASGSPGVEETSVTGISQGVSSGRESHVPDDLGDELHALRGSQGFGG